MATDKHQVRVDISGNAAMSWDGVIASRRDQGGTFGTTLLATLHQGTKSKAAQIHRWERMHVKICLTTEVTDTGLTCNIVLMSRRSTYPQCTRHCSRPGAGKQKSRSEIPQHRHKALILKYSLHQREQIISAANTGVRFQKHSKSNASRLGFPPSTHVATVSRAYWVQKACAAYCLFETHNQGKSNVYTAFSWRTSTKTDKGNSPHSACWDCGPPECALDGSTKTSSSSAPLWRIISLFSLSARCSSHYKWPTRQLMRVFLVRTRVLIPP